MTRLQTKRTMFASRIHGKAGVQPLVTALKPVPFAA